MTNVTNKLNRNSLIFIKAKTIPEHRCNIYKVKCLWFSHIPIYQVLGICLLAFLKYLQNRYNTEKILLQ